MNNTTETKANLAVHSDQRVGVFIDTQNLYHSAKSNFRANVNYEELLRVAVHGRKLVRAFAYVIRSDESTEEKFFGALEDVGIETRIKDLQVFHTGAKKADWDVGIAVDMIRLTEKVDVVVLASGDGDFIEVMRYCQSRGVRVEIMAFEKTTNNKIMEEADHFTDLGDQNYEFLIGHKRKGRTSAPRSAAPRSSAVPGYMKKQPPVQYSNSNLSAMNRGARNANNNVNPNIFGRGNKERKVKPVVGLPAKPHSPLMNGKTLINDQTKDVSPDNAFGNKPKTNFFNL